jgi:hypothetical protein
MDVVGRPHEQMDAQTEERTRKSRMVYERGDDETRRAGGRTDDAPLHPPLGKG